MQPAPDNLFKLVQLRRRQITSFAVSAHDGDGSNVSLFLFVRDHSVQLQAGDRCGLDGETVKRRRGVDSRVLHEAEFLELSGFARCGTASATQAVLLANKV